MLFTSTMFLCLQFDDVVEDGWEEMSEGSDIEGYVYW